MKSVKILTGLIVALSLAPASAGAATALYAGTPIGGVDSEDFTKLSPTPIVAEAAQVQASNSSAYALMPDGSVRAWGIGERGQLGDGKLTSSPEAAVKVAFPPGVKIISLGEAKNEAAAIDSNHHLWVWGANGSGSLGVRPAAIAAPIEVPGLTGVVAVAGGSEHMVVLTSSGTVLTAGTNKRGMLGLGEGVLGSSAFTTVPGLSKVVEINAGADYSSARTSEGKVFMWGFNGHGQCGVGSTAEVIWTPQRVELPEAPVSVRLGGDLNENGASLALMKTGALYGWGEDEHGAVGDQSTEDKLSPVNTGLHYVQIAAGGADGFGLTSQGVLEAWGSNTGAEMGIGGSAGGTFLTPTLVAKKVIAISATAKTLVVLEQ